MENKIQIDFYDGREFCFYCKKSRKEVIKLKCCARCKFYYYCSKECQTKDWKDGHQKRCILVNHVFDSNNRKTNTALKELIKQHNMKPIEKISKSSEPCECMKKWIKNVIIQAQHEKKCISCGKDATPYFEGYEWMCKAKYKKELQHHFFLKVCSIKCLFKMRRKFNQKSPSYAS